MGTVHAITATLAGSFRIGDFTPQHGVEEGNCHDLGGLRLLWTGQPSFEDGSAEDFLRACTHSQWHDPASLLARIHGPFALALLDSDNRRCLLAVDRLGLMPLAYLREHDRILFSSTLDRIREAAANPLEIDNQAIFDYLYFHMIPAPRTIYRGVCKLEPANYVIFDEKGSPTTGRYWEIPYREDDIDRADARMQLRELLEQAVARNINEGSTATFLSGGLDSTTVSGLYARLAPAPHRAFSVGFDAEGYDETPWAEAAARHFGLDLTTYYVTPQDVMDSLPLIAAAYDEPFGNASAIPAYFCARQAREQGIDCLLAGDGGDELFAGNSRYAKQLLFSHYDKLPHWIRKGILEPLAHLDTPAHRLPVVRKAVSYIRQGSLPMPERIESYNLLLRSGIDNVFSPEFLASVDVQTPENLMRSAYRKGSEMTLLKHMLALDMKITISDNDIRKVTHMCRLAGIEVRYPMLDEALVDFAAGLPSDWLLRRGELRAFYRETWADFLPSSTLEKSKHGFGLPFGVWAVRYPDLANLSEQSLTGIAGRGWIRPDYIEKLKKLHRGEHAAYYGVMTWLLTMLEQWLIAHEQ